MIQYTVSYVVKNNTAFSKRLACLTPKYTSFLFFPYLKMFVSYFFRFARNFASISRFLIWQVMG